MRGVIAKLIRKEVYGKDFALDPLRLRKYELIRKQDSFKRVRQSYVVVGLRRKYQAAKKAYRERHWRLSERHP